LYHVGRTSEVITDLQAVNHSTQNLDNPRAA
jgi:hypothetical protein